MLVEVVETEGKGKGLRATEDIQTGDVLIQEAPLYSERGHTLTPVQSVESMKALPQENLESIQELAASEGKKLREVGFEDADLVLLRALRTNAVALPDGGQALYSISCRANHSCQPNAALHPGMDGVMRLTALRTIHAGEEVNVSYIGEAELLRNTSRRQELLKRWGFECRCPRCVGADGTRGFLCPSCNGGRVYASTSENKWTSCVACGTSPSWQHLHEVEEVWERHMQSLKGPAADDMASAMYDGLVSSVVQDPASAPWPDAHWIAAKLAGSAAKALLRKGDAAGAAVAAQFHSSYARRVLLGAASRASAEARGFEAAAAAKEGEVATAIRYYDEALAEASLLPLTNVATVIEELQAARDALVLEQAGVEERSTVTVMEKEEEILGAWAADRVTA